MLSIAEHPHVPVHKKQAVHKKSLLFRLFRHEDGSASHYMPVAGATPSPSPMTESEDEFSENSSGTYVRLVDMKREEGSLSEGKLLGQMMRFFPSSHQSPRFFIYTTTYI